MKRKEFIRELEKAGCKLHRHGGRHDIYLIRLMARKLQYHVIKRLDLLHKSKISVEKGVRSRDVSRQKY